jgi:hypothetical protein
MGVGRQCLAHVYYVSSKKIDVILRFTAGEKNVFISSLIILKAI